jgi:ADP-ribose pyrophosphatase YjhB (NUDIX family)
MTDTDYRIIVGAIAEKDGKIILVQENKPQAYGLWNTPAGRLDKGELPADGAKREFKEETGFDIEIDKLLGIYVKSFDDITVLKIVFRARITGGEMKSQKDEIMDVKWFKPSDVLAMKDSELRNIRKEIEDFVNNRSYSLGIIRNL